MSESLNDPMWMANPVLPASIRLGVGWRMESQPVGFFDTLLGRDTAIDLDLACVLLDRQGQLLDQVWFKQVRSHDEAVRYQGDRVAGQASEALGQVRLEDLETIDLDLDKVSDSVHSIWLAVACSTGHQFGDLSRAHCRLFERQRDADGAEFCNVSLPLYPDSNTLLLARLQRDPLQLALWTLERLERPTQLESLADLPQHIQAQLGREQP